ncbi:Uncharacterised protein [Mycobacterium tuberculosis]|nr:Uncharacterised protein [Mycobacterium tuberculosis]COV38143.1 Uncharacterised protein [Mycobacterium tuberculosis]
MPNNNPPAPPGAPDPPAPPLPNNNPPAPPAAPVPGAPSAPLPISGRPNAARKGALIASSSGLVMDAALAASAAAYEPAPAVKACTNWI